MSNTRLIKIALALLLCVAAPAQNTVVVIARGSGGGGGGPAAFSDNFDRADGDSLGANWTEEAGDADIFSNTYRLSTGSFGVINSIYDTPTGSLTQYVKVTLGADYQYPWLTFRHTDSSSADYRCQLDGSAGSVECYMFASAADTSGDSIGTGSTSAFSAGNTFCGTVTGTGSSTVWRFWKNCTNLPSAADNWDGDTTPDITITDDPGAFAVDSGEYVGIGGQQGAADTVRLDNFTAGGLS